VIALPDPHFPPVGALRRVAQRVRCANASPRRVAGSILLLFLLGSAGGPVARAQPAGEDAGGAAAGDSSPEQAPATGTAAAGVPDSESAPGRAEAGDPSEYRATEQISEDLSVSFPVDI